MEESEPALRSLPLGPQPGVMAVGTDVDGMTPLEEVGGVPLDDPDLPLFISSKIEQDRVHQTHPLHHVISPLSLWGPGAAAPG